MFANKMVYFVHIKQVLQWQGRKSFLCIDPLHIAEQQCQISQLHSDFHGT